MQRLHDNHHSTLVLAAPEGSGCAAPGIEPVLIADWWCTTCGHGEADEHTRLCVDCTYMREGEHVRLAGPANAERHTRASLDDAITRLEQAQREVVSLQLDTERLLDGLEGGLYGALSTTAEAMHQLGSTLLATHTALTYARLATPADSAMAGSVPVTALEVVVTLQAVPANGEAAEAHDRAELAAAAVDGLLNPSALRTRGYRVVSVEGLEPCELDDLGRGRR